MVTCRLYKKHLGESTMDQFRLIFQLHPTPSLASRFPDFRLINVSSGAIFLKLDAPCFFESQSHGRDLR